MMIVLRNIFNQFISSLSLVVIVITLTFLLFPLDDWRELIYMKLYNLPFIAIIFMMVSIFSIISGVLTTQHWKQRMYFIERQLQHLVNGHPKIGRASCRVRMSSTAAAVDR